MFIFCLVVVGEVAGERGADRGMMSMESGGGEVVTGERGGGGKVTGRELVAGERDAGGNVTVMS